MKRFAFFSDLFFTFFISFLFSLLYFRHLGVRLWASLLLSVLCGGLITSAFCAYLYSKRKNLFLKKSEAERRDKLLFHLALAGDESNAEFFKDLLCKTQAETLVKRTGKNRLTTPNEVYFLQFSFAPVTADTVATFARLKTHRQKVLLCTALQDDAKKLCERLHIQIQDGDDIYAQVKTADAFPARFLGDDSAQTPKKRTFTLWFSKGNSKRFLVNGTLILLLSRLTPFGYYYAIFGTILLLTALFVRIFGKS